ncbi:MAG TPA: ABC transporter permease [Caulobacteraceae bacterium]|nr:ABC transporter permease [Caulobacteraceae bacterium]
MRRAFAPLALLVLVLAGWETACRALEVPAYFLPAPSDVAMVLAQRWPVLLGSAWTTLSTALVALFVAAAAAGGLALLAGLSDPLERALKPWAVALQVTPVVAIAPLVVIWAGLDHPERAVIALAAVVAFFPIFSGLLTGLKSADPDLERLFDLYGATRAQRLLCLRLPSAVPFLLEGLRVASGLAVIGAVVAEFVAGSGATQGLAWRILEAGNRLRTAEMFAALIVLAALGFSLNLFVSELEERAISRWRGRAR